MTTIQRDLTAEQRYEAKRLPYAFAKKYQVLIGESQANHQEIICATIPPADIIIELRRHIGSSISLNQVDLELFQQRLTRIYESNQNTTKQMLSSLEEELDLMQLVDKIPEGEDLLASEDDAPIIQLINGLFTQAIKREASDLHFETFEQDLRVRFRIDGILHDVLHTQRSFASFVLSRIKVMAKLDIAEKRLPQDGRISLRIAGRSIDVRVSTIPTNHGERAVLRLLDKNNARLDLSNLGMQAQTRQQLEKLINQPHGIILVTGPTGSGKSTTLYAALSQLNTIHRNILTVEEPIEYDLAGIGQTQVNSKIDMTFAKGLRAILRQDPDVVMVGEIRDGETAKIAVQASLTGHLVLSTLHTNTAVGAISRMVDLGVESFLLSSSLIGLLAQRLVRKLCPHCKQAINATGEQCELMQIDSQRTIAIYQAKGCEKCNQSGYRGRMGIYELITIDEQVKTMMAKQNSEQLIRRYCQENFITINKDGFNKVIAGETTLEEVLRVTSEM